MPQRNLGGLITSAIGLGCMGLSQGYGQADDEQSVRVIHRALDLGVSMLDTAMSYGQGHNEQLIARALHGRTGQAQIATKFGIVRDPGGVRVDGRPEHVRGYCEASLRRLGRDVIDLYYLHRADPEVPVADTVGAMAALVAEGKVVGRLTSVAWSSAEHVGVALGFVGRSVEVPATVELAAGGKVLVSELPARAPAG